MSDASTDVVSFQTGARSILSDGGNAGLGRPDAKTLLSGVGGHEYVLLNTEANELSRTNHIARRAAHDELSDLQQNARLAMFHQHQEFQLAV